MKTDQQTGELWGVGKMKQVRLKVQKEPMDSAERTCSGSEFHRSVKEEKELK